MKSPVFEKHYAEYLTKISEIDLISKAERIGAKVQGDELIIPFFNRPCRVSGKGIKASSGERPAYAICIVLFKYILLCPGIKPKETDWVAFKDFKNASPLVASFTNSTEKTIAKTFLGRTNALEKACHKVGGEPAGSDYPYDIYSKIHVLPKVPVLLLFNDADDEFPASCKVLFEKRAENYLDMECLAILGGILADYLKKAAVESSNSPR